MQIATITAEKQSRLEDKPDPKPLGDIVVVKIHVVPMCTEYKAFAAGHKSENLGHEAAGEVIAVAQPCRVNVGDRVVVMPLFPCGKCPLCVSGDYIYCQSMVDVLKATNNAAGAATYAQLMLKQDWMLLPIPDDLSYEHASMACCGLGPTFGAMQRMNVDAFDTVLITGMGPVGLGGVINGAYRGARMIAVESHPYRANLAKELGAAAVVDPNDPEALSQIRALTNGVGVDKGIDCSGAASARRLLIDAARRRGQVAFVGEGSDLTLDVSRDMLRKGLTLHGSWHWNLADAPRLMQVIRASGALLDKFITHTFPMSQAQQAWKLQVTGNCGKVLLYPWK
jgi:threonine dehydrogenase-like Zn-dependent dehydrogenase